MPVFLDFRATGTEVAMDILYTSDLHVSREHLHTLLHISGRMEVDCITVGGDLVPREGARGNLEDKIRFQRTYLEEEFIPAIYSFTQKNPEVPIYLDMGNDDFAANRDVLTRHEGELFSLLHMAKHPLTEGVDIIGYMCVPPTPFSLKDWEKPDMQDAPLTSKVVEVSGVYTRERTRFGNLDLESEDTIENDMSILSSLVDRPFIFVSHSPPNGTPLDLLYDGVNHVGSLAIRRFIEKWAEEGLLIASFHGHIHESAGVSGSKVWKSGKTPCFNPGQSFNDLQYIVYELL